MIRDRSIEEIFDGNYYSPGDMVLVGCSDCAGCSECCRNTGDSIILDPWDMYMLTKGTGKTFTDMIEREIEIRLVDGLILPNLMQHHESDETGERSGREDAAAPECAASILWAGTIQKADSAIYCRKMNVQNARRHRCFCRTGWGLKTWRDMKAISWTGMISKDRRKSHFIY